MDTKDLTQPQKEELALALLLWKDFKSGGKMDMKATGNAIMFAAALDISKEYEDMLTKLPAMKIVPMFTINTEER